MALHKPQGCEGNNHHFKNHKGVLTFLITKKKGGRVGGFFLQQDQPNLSYTPYIGPNPKP